ncbi:DM13 domain-containing protein [Agrococcus sp. ProA11]|uniref:DM13 domain-containing protein n=1 Tax=Agrococcus chionoecetis TaxID=3153752 RepID=UPI0032604724
MAQSARRRWIWWLGGGVLVVALVVGAVLFQPWRLFVDMVVDEEVPTADASPTEPATSEPAPSEPAPSEPAPAQPVPSDDPTTVELTSSSFISHEHPTTGTARVLRLASGERVLVLENLDTSNGPDLHVWLTDQPVIEGTDGWFVFDDGDWTTLGPLRGNIGTQQYAIPDDLDLGAVTSVSIWCERFAVSFGAAPLALS